MQLGTATSFPKKRKQLVELPPTLTNLSRFDAWLSRKASLPHLGHSIGLTPRFARMGTQLEAFVSVPHFEGSVEVEQSVPMQA